MSSDVSGPAWTFYDLPLHATRASDPSAAAPPRIDLPLLLHNVAWFLALRWTVVAVMLGVAGAAWLGGTWLAENGARLTPGWPLAVTGLLVAVNVVCIGLGRAANDDRRAARAALSLWLQIVLDLAALTVVVHYLGSVGSFTPYMYLFHIVLACIFFPIRQSILVTMAAMAMYGTCVGLELAGVLAPTSLWIAAGNERLPPIVLAAHVASVVFICFTVWYLASRLSGSLRTRDAELAASDRRLFAATEERAQHMLHTTHQLKAPFAAIHANTQLLLGGYCGELPPAARTVVEKIAARCSMLAREIKAMLQLANLRSSAQGTLKRTTVDLTAAIRECAGQLQPVATARGIQVELDLAPTCLRAVHDHARMIVENLLLNAINYSRDGGAVTVTCRPQPDGGARVAIADRGIGIAADKLPRIFDDYYRTAEAVAHNQSSTGLGLAIVRQAALDGRIGVRVESALGQGTVFTLDFPAFPAESEKPSSQETLHGIRSDHR